MNIFIVTIMCVGTAIHVGCTSESSNVVVTPSDLINVAENSNIVINCTLSDVQNPIDRCEWLRYDHNVTLLFENQEISACSCSLNLTRVSFDEVNGEWKCILFEDDTSNYTGYFYINVIVEPEVYFTVNGKNVTGDNFTVDSAPTGTTVNVCLMIVDSHPLPELQCKVEAKQNPIHAAPLDFDTRTKIFQQQPDSGLWTSNTTFHLRNGEYVSSSISISCKYTMITEKSPKTIKLVIVQRYHAQNIIVSSDNGPSVVTGENVTLHCRSDGNPIHDDFIWFFSLSEKGGWKNVSSGTSYKFKALIRDQGYYQCVSGEDSSTKSEPFYLSVQEVPVPSSPKDLALYLYRGMDVKREPVRKNTSVFLNETNEVLMVCETREGYPATNLTWHVKNLEEDEPSDYESSISYVTQSNVCGTLLTRAILRLSFQNNTNHLLNIECMASHKEWPKAQLTRTNLKVTGPKGTNRASKFAMSITLYYLVLPIYWLIKLEGLN